jgi:hypothetical protein
MQCSIKRIDLFSNGSLLGRDLPVDWQIEVSDSLSSRRPVGYRDIKFINNHSGCSYPAIVQKATSQSFPAIKSGLLITGLQGIEIAVLKTDTEIPT